MKTDSQSVETDRHQQSHSSQGKSKVHQNFHIEEVLDHENQPEPSRTNLVHQVHMSKGAKNIDGKGHHHDKRALQHRMAKKQLDVTPYRQLFEELGAVQVPYDTSMKAIVRYFCKEATSIDPFYIVDLSHFARQYLQWEKFLPRVIPFYAVKSNPSEHVLKVMSELGGCFDCASPKELDLVMKHRVDPAKNIVYSHPCKQIEHIKYFKEKGTELTVIDNEDELLKLKEHWPEARILIRVRTDDSHSESPFSTKFGASEKVAEILIKRGRELGLNIVGTSFHVGSSCTDATVYVKSIQSARCVWDIAETNGYQFTVLDIGGGFSGHDYDNPSFAEVAQEIHGLLDQKFSANVRIIGEPGRYFSAASTVLVTNIVARRVQTSEYRQSYTGLDQASDTKQLPESEREDMEEVQRASYLYYINDGIYGAFNAIVFDHKVFIVHTLTQEEVKDIEACKRAEEREKHNSVIWGPCCDSLDCIAHNIKLPLLSAGDWMWFPDMGAYTIASATHFNGFHTNKHHFIWKK